MLMPSIFRTNSLIDDLFDDDWFDDKEFKNVEKKLYGHRAKNVMNTDVKETEDGYELEMDLPGFKKEEVSVELNNGYITIRAAKGLDEDEKEKKTGKYIRRGALQRCLREKLLCRRRGYTAGYQGKLQSWYLKA